MKMYKILFSSASYTKGLTSFLFKRPSEITKQIWWSVSLEEFLDLNMFIESRINWGIDKSALFLSL